MFKKQEEINDLNDISLVNPDEEKQSILSLSFNIILDTLYNISTFLLLILIDNITIVLLNKDLDNRSTSDIIDFQLCINIFYILALLVTPGLMKILSSQGKIKKLYFEVISLVLIFILLFFIPLIVVLFILSPYYSKGYMNLLLLGAPIMFFKILTFINFKLLELKNKQSYILYLNLLFFFFYFITSYLLIIVLNKDIVSIGITYIIFYFLAFVFSMGLIKSSTKTFDEKDENDEEKSVISVYFENVKAAISDLFHSSASSKSNTGVKDKYDTDFKFISKNLKPKYDHMKDSVNEPLLNNQQSEEKKFSPFLCLNIFYNLFKISLLFNINFIGFSVIVFTSIAIEESKDIISNIVIYNILMIPYIIFYSFSTTLTNYVSVQSFSHSHGLKNRYTKVCSILLLAIAVCISLLINYQSNSIVRLYTNDPLVIENVESILLYYRIFVFTHFTSITLDWYVVSSSENIVISCIMISLFTLLIIPVCCIMIIVFGYAAVIYWWGYYYFTILHLVVNLVYIFIIKK